MELKDLKPGDVVLWKRKGCPSPVTNKFCGVFSGYAAFGGSLDIYGAPGYAPEAELEILRVWGPRRDGEGTREWADRVNFPL